MGDHKPCFQGRMNQPRSDASLRLSLLFSLAVIWLLPSLQLRGEEADGENNKAQASSPADTSTAPSPAEDEADPADSASSMSRYDALLAALTIFVLAIFVGFEVITKVPPTLHTPLMSGSNAISGITLVGAVIVAGKLFSFSTFLGMIAVVLASINVMGGFLVTHRMLAMFKSR